ncbi:hypothetical protein ACF0H5_006857 [Mactra antiquata]
MMKIRVAVIGCGAAGLCALRHLTARPELFDAVGFEQLNNVGGTWNYTDKIGTYDNGIPVQSSMYKNLRTNLPKEVMAFPDYPFPSNLPSFVSHEVVLKYLENYCEHFNLQQYIKLETRIDKVEPIEGENQTEWKVTSTCDGTTECNKFDSVIVCNGHYAVPLLPEIPGMDKFTGTIVHSHNYRVPEEFKDQVVICLGAGSSGQDICLDIATSAKQVILSHNNTPLVTPLPSNVSQKPGISELTADSVVYKDNTVEKIDVLLLCTGYKYDFPFLDDVCKVGIMDERVTPLYKHIIHAKYPSLSFIGICKQICPFPQFQNQVQFVLSMLDKSQSLPSYEAMLVDIDRDFNERLGRGLPTRYAHHMGMAQWDYNDAIAHLGGFQTIPKVWKAMYAQVSARRKENLITYKKRQYDIVDNVLFKEKLDV